MLRDNCYGLTTCHSDDKYNTGDCLRRRRDVQVKPGKL